MSGPPDAKPTAPGGFDPNFINSMLPDGTILRFPKGTDPAIVDKVYKDQLGQWMQAQSAKPKAPTVGTARAAGIGATQGLTANFGDEIASGIAATVGLPGDQPAMEGDWSQRYDTALDKARGVQHAAKDQHPVAYGAGQVAGAVAPALVAPEAFGANFVARAPTLTSAALRGAGTSGAYGAVTGFGEGEGGVGNRGVGAVKGAAMGAALGAGLGASGRAAQDLLNPAVQSTASQAAQTTANNLINNVNQQAVQFEPAAIQRLAQTIRGDMHTYGLRQRLQPRASGVMEEVDAIANNPNPTWQDLELLRRIAGRVFDPTNHSENEATRRIIDHIDNFMDNITPADVVAGNGPQTAQTMNDFRANWSSYRKADLLEDAVTRAQDRASSTGTGGNVVNAVRQNLRKILDSPKLSRGFTEHELDAIRQVVRGGAFGNLARMAASFAPSRGGLNAWLGAAATAIPGGQMLPAIGEIAHRVGGDATLRAANELPWMVQQAAPGAALRPGVPYSAAVARALGAAMPGGTTAANAYADALLNPATGGPR